jgi:hypothetical protein
MRDLDRSASFIDADSGMASQTGCNRQSEIYSLKFLTGVLAQLVERLNGIEEVTGSNPVGSISSFWNFGPVTNA